MSNASTLPGLSTPSPVDTSPDSSVLAAAPKRTRRALVALPLLAALGIGTATSVYLLGRGHETTNDAQVEGHVASVAARVSGQVQAVNVGDNQAVQAGDVLVQLDDRDQQAKVAAARADLAAMVAQQHAAETQLDVTRVSSDSNLVIARGGISQATAVEGTTRATIDRAQADLNAADSRRRLAQVELDRARKLVETGALSQSELDVKQSSFEQADAAAEQARAALASARANRDNSSGTLASARGRLIAAESGPAQVKAAEANVELATARVAQAQAALDRAELELSYTRVRASVSGVVSRRSVEVGQLASPERPLMALVPLDDTWVVANFKEDQIAEMHSGQAARVHIDTFDHELTGHVDSLASGTGSRFSLLPPDNASGNFTKVVQRVPVLIRLDPHPDFVLRPGMSATATVDTRPSEQ
ncbi:MAG TPA: HlyD family secretion protein [Polyangiaceae bacterium]|nr:HlyD family secretion protein [Polyangiaceae bacterium]